MTTKTNVCLSARLKRLLRKFKNHVKKTTPTKYNVDLPFKHFEDATHHLEGKHLLQEGECYDHFTYVMSACTRIAGFRREQEKWAIDLPHQVADDHA